MTILGKKKVILIGLGSNLSGEEFDSPKAVLEAALTEMTDCGITVTKLSRFYQSEPVPASDQPWFVNAVAAVETTLSAGDLLKRLHDIEATLGRRRRIRWEARIIDLDILAYHDQVLPSAAKWSERGQDVAAKEIIIPHPRLHERLFVLKPLSDICPDWTHPVLGTSVADFITIVEKQTDQGIIQLLD